MEIIDGDTYYEAQQKIRYADGSQKVIDAMERLSQDDLAALINDNANADRVCSDLYWNLENISSYDDDRYEITRIDDFGETLERAYRANANGVGGYLSSEREVEDMRLKLEEWQTLENRKADVERIVEEVRRG